jgi:GT2 family glycosyltransferase
MITFCLSTFNTINYLKLAIKSVRKNSFYKTAPFIVYAENCTDGTDEWLEENKIKYNLEIYIEKNDTPKGIGGGMNFCAKKVKTKYIGFLSSDFYVANNWDKELIDICENYNDKKLWVFSHRVEPDIFNDPYSRPGVIKVPINTFGEFYHNFNESLFLDWSDKFCSLNDITFPVQLGVSGIISKSNWDYIGGNDDRFAPMYWEDVDLFIRMLNEGYEFITTTKSVLFHFASRTSRFPDDNLKARPPHLEEYEKNSLRAFILKYGKIPDRGEYGELMKMPIIDGSSNIII